MEIRYPLPPFDQDSAIKKVQLAEDAWNTQNPEMIALAYTVDTEWRNRSSFIIGRNEVIAFLKNKWHQELNYKLKKELWAFHRNRIAVRFEYEYQNTNGDWYRAYGNENWEFDERGLMTKRFASINDVEITEMERRL